MNQTLIVRRAFDLVKRYRVLWLLGMLLALTSGGGGGGGGNGNVTWGQFDRNPFGRLTSEQIAAITGAVVGLLCLLAFLALAAVIVRYVVQAGLYRSVEQIEDSDRAPTLREGFRLGWNWRAFRLFLIDVVVGIPTFLVVLLLLGIAASPLLLLLVDNQGVRIASIVLTVALVLLAILVMVVGITLVTLVQQFVYRAAVLDDAGVFDAIKQGIATVRAHFRDIAILWLLMFGIGLAYGLLMIPVFIVVLALAALIGLGPGWLIFQTTESIVAALLVGGPLFLAVLIVPLTIIGGFFEAFRSTAWTLAYREVRALPA